MKYAQYRTVNGQAISPYEGAAPGFPTTRTLPNGIEQKLCQILPASPQRFEWVNKHNIREVKA